jgi:hypothetical protein
MLGRAALRRRRPVQSHTTIVLTRLTMPEIAKIASINTYSPCHWSSCRAKRRRPLAKSDFIFVASHILPLLQINPRRRHQVLGRRRACSAPQDSTRVQTTGTHSSQLDLTIIPKTVSGVPPVGITGRRGNPLPSGATARRLGIVLSRVDHTLALKTAWAVIGRNYCGQRLARRRTGRHRTGRRRT